MWYTAQQPGHFNLLPTSGRQESKGRRNEYFTGGKKCFSAQNIFSVIEPNKTELNKET
jgi:hypothetical protein